MTFLAPLFLAAGAAAALVVGVLHFLARRRPREVPLPTARFLPERAAESASRSARPSDLALMAMRVLALLLAAAAFARPVLRGARRPVARVILADLSRDARSRREVIDSVRALAVAGDIVIAFDSVARTAAPASLDSLGSAAVTANGSLSAALVAARRSVLALRDGADSVELAIVSPLARDELDAATARIRAEWQGRARLVRVAAAAADSASHHVELRGAPGDPLRATVALAGGASPADARIVRDAVAPADSAWAREQGRLLVEWPASVTAADTTGAVIAGDVVVVAALPRAVAPAGNAVVARWADGAPAATQSSLGAGCIRHVAVAVPVRGDLALRDGMQRFTRAMLAPCGGASDVAPVSDSIARALAGSGPLLSTDALPTDSRSAIEPWLFGAVLALLLGELAVRARSAA